MAEKIIQFKDVGLAFGENVVLKKINLEIQKGETVAIVGPSGTGKSTLLRILIGLLDASCGEVFVFGESINSKNEDDWNKLRKNMGMVFQYSALFDFLTVFENIAFGLRHHTNDSEEEIKSKVSKMLDIVGLSGIEDQYPASLSGGMKKRVSLARAIAINPEVLLYDEPTAGLDPIMANVITELIIDIKKRLGATSILVTHDMQSAFRASDKVAMIYDGNIVEMLATEEFKRSRNPLVYNFINGKPLDTPMPCLKDKVEIKEDLAGDKGEIASKGERER